MKMKKIRHFSWDILMSDTIFKKKKTIKVFQWLSKSKFLSFMTKVNPNNENEKKSDIFHGTYWCLTPYLKKKKLLKFFNAFQNKNFSVLWLKWTQRVEVKQNQTLFHGTYSNLTLFFTGRIFHWKFIIGTFQFHCKSEHKQVKWNKITQNLSKSDRIYIFYLQSSTFFQWLLKFFSW